MSIADRTWESAFNVIEQNAHRVPIFRKFIGGEELTAADVVELTQGAKDLGLYEFAMFAANVTPDVLQSMAKAIESIEGAKRVHTLWKQYLG